MSDTKHTPKIALPFDHYEAMEATIRELRRVNTDLLEAAKGAADRLDEVAGEFGHHNVIMDSIAILHAAVAKAE